MTKYMDPALCLEHETRCRNVAAPLFNIERTFNMTQYDVKRRIIRANEVLKVKVRCINGLRSFYWGELFRSGQEKAVWEVLFLKTEHETIVTEIGWVFTFLQTKGWVGREEGIWKMVLDCGWVVSEGQIVPYSLCTGAFKMIPLTAWEWSVTTGYIYRVITKTIQERTP